jgi:hypothetical protein
VASAQLPSHLVRRHRALVLTCSNKPVTRLSDDWAPDTKTARPHPTVANLVRSVLRAVLCSHSSLERHPLVRRTIHWAILHIFPGPAFEPRHPGCPLETPHSIRLHTALFDFPTLPAPFPRRQPQTCSSSFSPSHSTLAYGLLRDSSWSWLAADVPFSGETALSALCSHTCCHRTTTR